MPDPARTGAAGSGGGGAVVATPTPSTEADGGAPSTPVTRPIGGEGSGVPSRPVSWVTSGGDSIGAALIDADSGAACGAARRGGDGTWISTGMIAPASNRIG